MPYWDRGAHSRLLHSPAGWASINLSVKPFHLWRHISRVYDVITENRGCVSDHGLKVTAKTCACANQSLRSAHAHCVLVRPFPLLIEYFYSKKKRQRPDSNPRPLSMVYRNVNERWRSNQLSHHGRALFANFWNDMSFHFDAEFFPTIAIQWQSVLKEFGFKSFGFLCASLSSGN